MLPPAAADVGFGAVGAEVAGGYKVEPRVSMGKRFNA